MNICSTHAAIVIRGSARSHIRENHSIRTQDEHPKVEKVTLLFLRHHNSRDEFLSEYSLSYTLQNPDHCKIHPNQSIGSASSIFSDLEDDKLYLEEQSYPFQQKRKRLLFWYSGFFSKKLIADPTPDYQQDKRSGNTVFGYQSQEPPLLF